MIRTVVFGAGRMARRVLTQLEGCSEFVLVAVVAKDRPDDLPGYPWFDSLEDVDSAADLLIDFTLPGGTGTAAAWCEQRGVALLSGTTGLSDDDIGALKNAAMKVAVLWAPNMSYGVALMTSLVRQVAAALDPAAAINIADIHHKHKLDAPSGTALALAAAAMEGRGASPEDVQTADSFDTGSGGTLTFTSEREGEVIGEHTVSFAMPGEVLEIKHRALHRDVFARGALQAGQWLAGQAPGYYGTRDWLDLP